ncbi:MAG: hypothetical protein ACLQJ0_22355 [Steroidobacteraceae bacterium]
MNPADLLIPSLRSAFRSGRLTGNGRIPQLPERADQAQERHVWIARLSRAQVMRHVEALADASEAVSR